MISIQSIRNVLQNRRHKDELSTRPFYFILTGNVFSNMKISCVGENEQGAILVINELNNDKALTLNDVLEMVKPYEKGVIKLSKSFGNVLEYRACSMVDERHLAQFNLSGFGISVHDDLLARVDKRERLNTRHITMQLNYLENYLTDSSIPFDFNPVFQRGHVWTREQEIAFMENFIRNPLAVNRAIYFNDGFLFNPLEKNDKNDMIAGKMVCLDGLQRLTAVRNFMKGEFTIFGNMSWNDIQKSPQVYHILSDCDLDFYETSFCTNEDVLKFYLDFNSTGVKHSEEELQRVQSLLLEEIF